MVRLLKSLFAISDGLAWLLLFFAAICTVAVPVVVPAYRRIEHGDASILPMAGIALLCACVAAGAYGLARRRAWALVPVLLPAIVELCLGRIAVAAVLGIPMLVVFGTPYLFVLMHAWVAAKRH
jgi:hypothetical protein